MKEMLQRMRWRLWRIRTWVTFMVSTKQRSYWGMRFRQAPSLTNARHYAGPVGAVELAVALHSTAAKLQDVPAVFDANSPEGKLLIATCGELLEHYIVTSGHEQMAAETFAGYYNDHHVGGFMQPALAIKIYREAMS